FSHCTPQSHHTFTPFPTRRSSDLLPVSMPPRSGKSSRAAACMITTSKLPLVGCSIRVTSGGVIVRVVTLALAGSELLERSPVVRSDEHTSELQSRFDLVCRLLLEK